MSNEQWMPVAGFEGCIEVSDAGRVRSLNRVLQISGSAQSPPYERVHRGRILKACLNDGYVYVALHGDKGRRNSVKVHQLVLEAFVGPCPPGMESCHNNGDSSDNRLSNLRWDTHLANIADKVAHGTAQKSQCPHGHDYTPENTRMVKHTRGHWYKRCRTCAKQWAREADERRSKDPVVVARKKQRDRERWARNRQKSLA